MNDQLCAMHVEPSHGSLLVRLSGEIDLSNSNRLHEQLEHTIEGWSTVSIDLTGIEYLDSQGLRVIKQLCDKVARDGTELRLIAPRKSLARQVLEMVRMGDYTEIRDALER